MRTKITNNFRAAKDAGHEAIEDLIDLATTEMHDVASRRLETGAAQRGYDLPVDIQKEASAKDGKITYEPFYGRWFEYGTVTIPAMSFMRPGARAGRKHVKTHAPDIFQGRLRRKAAVRR